MRGSDTCWRGREGLDSGFRRYDGYSKVSIRGEKRGRGLFYAASGDAGSGVDHDGVGEEIVEAAFIASDGHHEQDDGKQG